jgi:hydroxylamine reductase (hybrid-cluster protein)
MPRDPTEKVLCEICGCFITKVHFARHEVTKKHRQNYRASEEGKKEREKSEREKRDNIDMLSKIYKKLEILTKDERKFIRNKTALFIKYLPTN